MCSCRVVIVTDFWLGWSAAERERGDVEHSLVIHHGSPQNKTNGEQEEEEDARDRRRRRIIMLRRESVGSCLVGLSHGLEWGGAVRVIHVESVDQRRRFVLCLCGGCVACSNIKLKNGFVVAEGSL